MGKDHFWYPSRGFEACLPSPALLSAQPAAFLLALPWVKSQSWKQTAPGALPAHAKGPGDVIFGTGAAYDPGGWDAPW